MPPKMRDLTDEDIVLAVLEHPSKLDKFETTIFNEWIVFLQKGRQLSEKQRAIAERKFKFLDLLENFDRDKLASTMAVKGAKTNARTPEALNSLMGPKPAAPPRRPKLDF